MVGCTCHVFCIYQGLYSTYKLLYKPMAKAVKRADFNCVTDFYVT